MLMVKTSFENIIRFVKVKKYENGNITLVWDEITKFLKWLDNVSDCFLIQETLNIPDTIKLSDKSIKMLLSEGYIIFRNENRDLMLKL